MRNIVPSGRIILCEVGLSHHMAKRSIPSSWVPSRKQQGLSYATYEAHHDLYVELTLREGVICQVRVLFFFAPIINMSSAYYLRLSTYHDGCHVYIMLGTFDCRARRTRTPTQCSVHTNTHLPRTRRHLRLNQIEKGNTVQAMRIKTYITSISGKFNLKCLLTKLVSYTFM